MPDHLVGTQVRCPSCQSIFRATTSDEPGQTEPTGIREDEYRSPAAPTEPMPLPSRRMPPKPILEEHDDDDDDLGFRPSRRRYYAPHRGGMVLTFGILGLVGPWLCTPLCLFCIAAWVMGHSDLKEMKAGRMDPEGEGQTRVGWILGIVGTALIVLGLVTCMFWFLIVRMR